MVDTILIGGGQLRSTTALGADDDGVLTWTDGSGSEPGDWADTNWHNVLVYPVTNQEVSAESGHPKINSQQQVRSKFAYADAEISDPDQDIEADITIKRLYVAVNLAYVLSGLGTLAFTDGFGVARCRLQVYRSAAWTTVLGAEYTGSGAKASSFMPSSNLTVYCGPIPGVLGVSVQIPPSHSVPMPSAWTNADGPYSMSFSRMMFHPPIPSAGIALTTAGTDKRMRLQLGCITTERGFEYDCWAKLE